MSSPSVVIHGVKFVNSTADMEEMSTFSPSLSHFAALLVYINIEQQKMEEKEENMNV